MPRLCIAPPRPRRPPSSGATRSCRCPTLPPGTSPASTQVQRERTNDLWLRRYEAMGFEGQQHRRDAVNARSQRVREAKYELKIANEQVDLSVPYQGESVFPNGDRRLMTASERIPNLVVPGFRRNALRNLAAVHKVTPAPLDPTGSKASANNVSKDASADALGKKVRGA